MADERFLTRKQVSDMTSLSVATIKRRDADPEEKDFPKPTYLKEFRCGRGFRAVYELSAVRAWMKRQVQRARA